MTTTASTARVDRIVSTFVRSDYFANWQSEHLESGGYARPDSDARDRFDRCYEAAEDGADGSTHRECIDDMRSAFRDWLQDRRRGRWQSDLPCLEAAVDAHFDRLETWHTEHGTIDQEIA